MTEITKGVFDDDRGVGELDAEAKVGRATAYLLRSPLPAAKLDVPVFTTAGGMLNREDHDLFDFIVNQVIDEIAIFGGHKFADAVDILGTTDLWKPYQVLKSAKYCCSDCGRCGRIT